MKTLLEVKALNTYYETYKPKAVQDKKQQRHREKLIFGGLIVSLGIISLILYKK